MAPQTDLWLVCNARSGSNDDAALEALHDSCGNHGLCISRTLSLPDDELPDAATLDAAGIATLAVFGGDGTLNAAITKLYGWSGAVLVLPGGTMNLLPRRLHGDAEVEEILGRVAQGGARKVRPNVIRSRHGDAFAGLLVGPGTRWSKVREAMRDVDLSTMAEATIDAVRETAVGPRVACVDPQLGDREGYPLIEMTPGETGAEIAAFKSETAGEYVEQALALARRSFRDGPHEVLGVFATLVLEDSEGTPLGMLIDGEQADGTAAREELTVVKCEVDLLASAHGC